MRVNIGSRLAAAALGLGLLPGACSLPSQSGFFEAYLHHPDRTLKDTVLLLEGKSDGERRKTLERVLRARGIPYQVQRYIADPNGRAADEGVNLIFDLGDAGKTLIISAHYDAVSGSPGANDDASCISAILDAHGRLRRASPANLKVRFILFDGEESGLKGSEEYVRVHGLKDVLAMFSLELCGIGDAVAVWESKERERKTPGVRTLLQTLKKINVAHLVEGEIPEFGSDHKSFTKAGIPALALSIFPKGDEPVLREFIFHRRSPRWANRENWPSIFRHYHTPSDTADRLREGAMRLMSEVIYRTVVNLDRGLKREMRPASPARLKSRASATRPGSIPSAPSA